MKQSARAPSQVSATSGQRQNGQGESLIRTASAATGDNGDADSGGATASEGTASSPLVGRLAEPPDAVSSVKQPRPDAEPRASDTTAARAPSAAPNENDTPANQQPGRAETSASAPAPSDDGATNPEPASSPSSTSDQSSTDSKSTELSASEHISRTQLTSEMNNKEPGGRINGVFHSDNEPLRRLYFFTEITGLRGHTVTHNWWHDGRLIAKVKSRVRGYSWRMSSSKKLIPSMAGPWRVTATDDQGHTLSVAEFLYKVP